MTFLMKHNYKYISNLSSKQNQTYFIFRMLLQLSLSILKVKIKQIFAEYLTNKMQ